MADADIYEEHFENEVPSAAYDAIIMADADKDKNVIGDIIFGKKTEPTTTINVIFHQPVGYMAKIELQFHIHWTDSSTELRHEVMKFFLVPYNVKDIKCRSLTGTVTAKAKNHFRNTTPEAIQRDGKLYFVNVDYTAEMVHAANLFGLRDPSFYGEMSRRVAGLGILFGKPRPNLGMYIVGADVHLKIEDMKRRFVAELRDPPLSKWYPSHPNKIFIQYGDDQYPDPEERPKPRVPTQQSFMSSAELVTKLGFAAIQEQEYVMAQAQTLSASALNMRFMTIPGAGNRRYMAFIEKPEYVETRVVPGDSLRISFDVEDRYDDLAWNAFVIDPMPFSAMNDITVIISRPWDKEKKQWKADPMGGSVINDAGIEVPIQIKIDPVQVEKHVDADTLAAALWSAPAIQVGVRVIQSEVDLKRQINSLSILQEKITKSTDLLELLLGNDYRSLSKVNLFENVDADLESQIKPLLEKAGFNAQQSAALLDCLSLAGGMGNFQGPPGCGKTYFLTWLALVFIVHRSKAKNPKGPSLPCKVLLTAGINDPVNDLARKLKDLASKHISDREIIVIRYHCLKTETEILYQPATKTRTPSEDARPEYMQETDLQILDEMSSAYLVRNLYDSATKTKFGIADKRVQHLDLALGTWMLKFAGVIDFPRSERHRFADFTTSYDKWRNSVEMTRGQIISFREQIKDLREFTIQQADAIVTTLSNTAVAELYTNFRPDFVAIDEAGKATEPNMWHVLAHYNPTAYVMVGDEKQLGPVVASTAKSKHDVPNCFAKQLKLALFTRMVFNGFPTRMFDTQSRMVPEIAEFVSTCFYNGKLNDGPSVTSRPLSQELIAYNSIAFGKKSPLVFLNLNHSLQKRDTTKSSYNLIQAVQGLDLVLKLMARDLVQPEDIMIIAPYLAQVRVYNTGLARMQAKNPDFKLRDIAVRTVDKVQGQERRVVILDLTITEKIGFLNFSRLCVACSRAQDGLYVIFNIGGIMRHKQAKRGPLSRIVNFARDKALVSKTNCYTASEFISEDTIKWDRNPIQQENPFEQPDSVHIASGAATAATAAGNGEENVAAPNPESAADEENTATDNKTAQFDDSAADEPAAGW